MSDLILDSLEVENFKAFKRLTIERLGRVNLIVGKNNVGKTCLLEALWLYATGGQGNAIEQILESRQEKINGGIFVITRSLLHYGEETTENKPIQIGSINSKNKVTGVAGGNFSPIVKNNFSVVYPCTFIHTYGLYRLLAKKLWDNIYLTLSQDEIKKALQLLEPRILDIGAKVENDNLLPVVRLVDRKKPVLLSNLGEGMKHIFNFALALVNVKNGILLIDEIENGLHYSIQPQVWRFIFDMAKQLNVQVFATTHSWDTIEAFEQIAYEYEEHDSMFISLRKRHDDPDVVVGVTFDKHSLSQITSDHIEMR